MTGKYLWKVTLFLMMTAMLGITLKSVAADSSETESFPETLSASVPDFNTDSTPTDAAISKTNPDISNKNIGAPSTPASVDTSVGSILKSHPANIAPPVSIVTPSAPVTSSSGEPNTPEYVIIRPSDQATFSSETAAQVSVVPYREGASFKKGDVLLKFDCRLQAAELKKAQAQQTESTMGRKSAEQLVKYGSISTFELVKAQSEEQMANADVDKLTATVDKCIIKAPFNGSVADVIVHPDETVKPGDPLLKIVNTEYLEFEIQIPSQWLAWLHVGSMFNVRLNEIKKTISAKVTMINPEIEPVSQSVKIIAVITPADPTLLPGMSGQAIFTDNPDASEKSFSQPPFKKN